MNDLDLKHGYGLKAAADNATAMNDLAVEDFAAQHPDMAFIHAYPGIVRTPLLNNFHWSIRLLSPIVKLISVSPAECAQWMLYTLLDPQFSKGAFYRYVKGVEGRIYVELMILFLGITMRMMLEPTSTALLNCGNSYGSIRWQGPAALRHKLASNYQLYYSLLLHEIILVDVFVLSSLAVCCNK